MKIWEKKILHLFFQLGPLNANLLPVNSDSQGLDPSHLRKVLSRWNPSDASRPGSGIPRLLYCIPNGGNPTGSSLNLERKKEIYKIAQEYDLLIMEDDPYFYIQFTKVCNKNTWNIVWDSGFQISSVMKWLNKFTVFKILFELIQLISHLSFASLY